MNASVLPTPYTLFDIRNNRLWTYTSSDTWTSPPLQDETFAISLSRRVQWAVEGEYVPIYLGHYRPIMSYKPLRRMTQEAAKEMIDAHKRNHPGPVPSWEEMRQAWIEKEDAVSPASPVTP